jgi:hypothetical protein
MLLVFYSMRCPALVLGLVADQNRPTIHGGAGRDRFSTSSSPNSTPGCNGE